VNHVYDSWNRTFEGLGGNAHLEDSGHAAMKEENTVSQHADSM
jgi:hypothetical protein